MNGAHIVAAKTDAVDDADVLLSVSDRTSPVLSSNFVLRHHAIAAARVLLEYSE